MKYKIDWYNFWEVTERSLLMACKEDDSAFLVIYMHAIVFKNIYEVALDHSPKFLPELVFYYLLYEKKG